MATFGSGLQFRIVTVEVGASGVIYTCPGDRFAFLMSLARINGAVGNSVSELRIQTNIIGTSPDEYTIVPLQAGRPLIPPASPFSFVGTDPNNGDERSINPGGAIRVTTANATPIASLNIIEFFA